jgi:hypothetical protein
MRVRHLVLLALPLFAGFPSQATANYQSQTVTMNLANQPSDPTAGNYGSVRVEAWNGVGTGGGGLTAGEVRISVTITNANGNPTALLDSFSFNSTVSPQFPLSDVKSVTTSNGSTWSVSPGGNEGPSHNFSFTASGNNDIPFTGSTNLTILIDLSQSGQTSQATLANFITLGDTNGPDPAIFAAHIKGLTFSSYFIRAAAVPEPSSLLLAVGGCCCGLVYLRRRRKWTSHAPPTNTPGTLGP